MTERRLELNWMLAQLQQAGILNQEQAFLVRSKADQDPKLHPLNRIARENFALPAPKRGILSIDFLLSWLSEQTGLPVYHLDPLKVDVDAVTEVMSYGFAQRHEIIAVSVTADSLTVATCQPFEHAWESNLSHTSRRELKRVLMDPADILQYQVEFYKLARSVRGAKSDNKNRHSKTGNFEQLLELGKRDNLDVNDQHIVSIVDWLLQYAFNQRASDIHLEPRREETYVRFRIDGVLHRVYDFPASVGAAVLSRFKILGRMDVTEKRKPQDGRIKTRIPDGDEVELRLSTLPTAFGEKLVLRIFDPSVLVKNFRELGLNAEDLNRWNRLIEQPTGIILVTGPTGSGKTTTLYSTLKQLATPEVNVSTVEDPIEMIEPSFNQTQVNPDTGMTFASGIRALMRQDPDIIMIGEIRDRETAEMAIQAALTGHLVISTLHTNDAPSAVTRLIDLGVPAYLLHATLLGIMAQRLVRILCPHCKQQAPIDADLWREMLKPRRAVPPPMVYQATGCLECRNTGFLGRQGIYEIMPLSAELKAALVTGANPTELRERAVREGMLLLRWSGAQKILAGLTTLEEVMRVAPAADVVLTAGAGRQGGE